MKEEKKQTRVKADSPHRIVNIHRNNMSSREALEESTHHKAGKTVNRSGNRIPRKSRSEENTDSARNTQVQETGRRIKTSEAGKNTKEPRDKRTSINFSSKKGNENVKR